MISFIVIGRNEGWKLKACLDAIERVVKTDKILDYEIIYVDSRSSDNSITLAKSYPNTRVFLITGECNAGVGRNIGAMESKGEILFFLDGDMELQEGVISNVLIETGSLKYPFYSGLHLNRVFDEDMNLQEEYVQTHPEGIKEYFQIATGGLMLIERYWWNKMSGIDTRFRYNEDYDFGLRMTEHHIKPCRQCKIWVVHNTYPHETRSNYVSSVRYTSVLFRKHWWNVEFLYKKLLPSQYTAFALLFVFMVCIFGAMAFPTWLWCLMGLLYIAILIRKAMNQHEVGISKMMWLVFKRDIVFLTSILTFWPKPIELKYEEK